MNSKLNNDTTSTDVTTTTYAPITRTEYFEKVRRLDGKSVVVYFKTGPINSGNIQNHNMVVCGGESGWYLQFGDVNDADRSELTEESWATRDWGFVCNHWHLETWGLTYLEDAKDGALRIEFAVPNCDECHIEVVRA